MSTGDEAHYNSLLYTAVMLQHPSLRLRSASQTTSDHNHQDSSLNPHLSSHTTTLCLSLRQQVFHNGHFLLSTLSPSQRSRCRSLRVQQLAQLRDNSRHPTCSLRYRQRPGVHPSHPKTGCPCETSCSCLSCFTLSNIPLLVYTSHVSNHLLLLMADIQSSTLCLLQSSSTLSFVLHGTKKGHIVYDFQDTPCRISIHVQRFGRHISLVLFRLVLAM